MERGEGPAIDSRIWMDDSRSDAECSLHADLGVS